jgi:hypothetical protein
VAQWLRSICVDGNDCLPELPQSPERLSHIYHVPLFTPDCLQELGLPPTAYVYFYLNANRTVKKLKQTSRTRGQMVAEQEKELFQQIAARWQRKQQNQLETGARVASKNWRWNLPHKGPC